MKIMKKVLLGIFLLLVFVLIAGFFLIRNISRKGLPDYNQDVSLKGIKEEVLVFRDSFAVPHIYAKNKDDLYKAVGYLMAQDRLWQMDLLRRVTTGRLSEIFGKDFIETDLLMRSLRIPEKSRAVIASTDAEILGAAEAFCDGVNQFLETHQNKLPPEFSILRYKPERWTLEHSANLIGYMAWDLAFAWQSDVLLFKLAEKLGAESEKFRDLIPGIGRQDTVVYPNFHPGFSGGDLGASFLRGARKIEELGLVAIDGSNNWAISGQKSRTGKPLLANDMHLALFAPGIWYQMHQVVEGKLNVTGVVLPGQPFIICGHNEKIAWGMTNIMVDDMDFYLEKINPQNPGEYEFNGQWKKLEIRKEKIPLKGGKTVERELRFSHRGPIISEFQKAGDRAISMRWIGNSLSNELRSVYLLNRASNWAEFKDAVRTFNSISENIVYADVDGNIGLFCAGGIPIRKGSGIGVVPGETDEYDWTGIVPFEELPFSFNPAEGHVSSANNRTANEEYPYPISYFFDVPDRIDRIREMLEEKEIFSAEDFIRMQADFRSKLVEKIKNDIIAGLGGGESYEVTERRAIELLAAWDGVLAPESPAASLFEEFHRILLKNILLDDLGSSLYEEFAGNIVLAHSFIKDIFDKAGSELWDDQATPAIRETPQDVIRKSFNQAVASLQDKAGQDPESWTWRKIHTLTLQHPLGQVKILAKLFGLNRGPFGVGGSYHTVCPYGYDLEKGYESNSGASMRHVYSLDNWDESLSVIPTGVSGIPASPHYCDQSSIYINNEYHPELFSRKAVEENFRYRMKISGKS